jgi:hypothetical protein
VEDGDINTDGADDGSADASDVFVARMLIFHSKDAVKRPTYVVVWSGYVVRRRRREKDTTNSCATRARATKCGRRERFFESDALMMK